VEVLRHKGFGPNSSPKPITPISEPNLEQTGPKPKISKKCIRCKKDRVKMVLGLDVEMDKVEGLMSQPLVGRFTRKLVKGESLRLWLDAGWRKSRVISLDSTCWLEARFALNSIEWRMLPNS
jgi:hypothetical protein